MIDSVNDNEAILNFDENYDFDGTESLQLHYYGKDKNTGKEVISVYASIEEGDFKTNDLLKVRRFGSDRMNALKEKLAEILGSL
jgi:hypothetical protein